VQTKSIIKRALKHTTQRMQRLLPLKTEGSGARKIVPGALPTPTGEDENLRTWGFKDTAFHMAANGDVTLSGSHYLLAGQTLPALVPWVQDVMQLTFDVNKTHRELASPKVPAARRNTAFTQAIRTFLQVDQINATDSVRLRHGHGHTQEEIYAVRYDSLPRVPDLVVFPSSASEVAQLVQAASVHDVCLIPFGGGTNVTEALLCPSNEERFIVSVDMRRMNRIAWIDPVNQMACIEAGAVGRHLVDQLKQHGFTLGHEPDSIEFSTLGGWIATNASGMKKNKYGNIEDLVLNLTAVTASGVLEHRTLSPRESIGIDLRKLMFGSEGRLGIITSAVVKIFPLPQVQRYGSILFHSFTEGVAFMRELAKHGDWPASVRLVDNLQFQFGMALKPANLGLKAYKSKLEKLFVTQLKGFDPNEMVAITLVFEGSEEQVARQERAVYEIAARYRGLKAGSENGKRGYQLTYGIAYIRDFVMQHFVLAESFETSAAWSDVENLCNNVKKRIVAEHAARKLPGKPFVTCRVTQIYETGACIYFYFGMSHFDVEEPTKVYAEIERAARDEILKSGGSLSHHHGVGKLRQRYLSDIWSPAARIWDKDLKRTLDPQNIFGCSNQVDAGGPSIAKQSPSVKQKRTAE
jgi:alkyldihydroxyacetonephosphate synthase